MKQLSVFWSYLRTHVTLFVFPALLIMFVLGYFESLRWPLPGPKATHGFLKALFLGLVFILIFFRTEFKQTKHKIQNLLLLFYSFAYVLSSLFSQSPGTSFLNLWYPLISATIIISFSKITLKQKHIYIFISICALLILTTFVFAFFSIFYRYSVDNLYYFIFLDHRANYFLSELRNFGKYVSLGPYIMLAPLCFIFLVQKHSSLARRIFSLGIILMTTITAVISNNRIDVLIMAIHFSILLFLVPRRTAVIILAIVIPLVTFSLSVSQIYYGFNLAERILTPKIERDLETIDMRFTYWQTALYNFRNYPLVGSGPNSYNDVSDFPLRHYYDPGTRQYTVRADEGIGIHNIFIERLSDTGLIGFSAFIAILFFFLRTDVIRFINFDPEKRKVYLLFALSSWTWILYGVTDNGYGAQGMVTFFVLRGIVNHL